MYTYNGTWHFFIELQLESESEQVDATSLISSHDDHVQYCIAVLFPVYKVCNMYQNADMLIVFSFNNY